MTIREPALAMGIIFFGNRTIGDLGELKRFGRTIAANRQGSRPDNIIGMIYACVLFRRG